MPKRKQKSEAPTELRRSTRIQNAKSKAQAELPPSPRIQNANSEAPTELRRSTRIKNEDSKRLSLYDKQTTDKPSQIKAPTIPLQINVNQGGSTEQEIPESQEITDSLTQKKAKHVEVMRKVRQNPEYRAKEKTKHAEYLRNVRENPDYRTPEKEKDAAFKRKARQNPDYRTQEKTRDAEAHSQARQDPIKRKKIISDVTESQRKKRKSDKFNLEYLLNEYNKRIHQSPEFICSCCGGLWYESSTKVITREQLEDKGLSASLITTVLNVNQNVHRLCGTCRGSVFQKQVPKLCLTNGFKFPDVPPELQVKIKVNVNKKTFVNIFIAGFITTRRKTSSGQTPFYANKTPRLRTPI
jgi:hypothetical protein